MPRVSFRVPGEITSNDLTVDATTLTVDETNNRIGIATASPAYTLDVSGIIRGSSGVIGLTSTGAPAVTIADGAYAIDTTNHTFYFRSGSTWRQVGGASLTTQDANPTYAANSLWYESDTGKLFIGYDGYWVEVSSAGPVGPNAVINTDGSTGKSIYVGTTNPTVGYTPAVGDIWIRR